MGYSDNFFAPTNILRKIGGVWIPKKDDPLRVKIGYLCYNLILLTTSLTYFACETLMISETIKKLNTFVAYFGLFFTHIIGIAKFCMLIAKRKDFENIQEVLEKEEYEYEAAGDFQPAQIFMKERRFFKIMSVVVIVSYTGVGISAHISSFISLHLYNNKFGGDYFDGNITCLDFMPYYSYIPFSTETKAGCRNAFWFMDIPLDIMAFYIAAFDATFVSILCSLKTHFIILKGAFKSIRERCLLRLNLPKNYEILYDGDNPELEREMYMEIRQSTIHLMALLRTCQDVEDVFNLFTLGQTLASLLIFASCLFVASTVPMSSPAFFSSLDYFSAVLFQLSTYCWFGNEMTQASADVVNGLYESNWLSSSKRFRVSMLLTMTRMHRPVYVSIGKFTPMALVTLVSVCRGSFSYFAVFKNVQ